MTGPADRWARSPSPTGPEPDPKASGLWLVCADGLGLGARVVRRLAAERVPAATVVPGAAFARLGERAWTLPPGDREGCVALLAGLGERPAVLLHLWALAPEAGLPGSADLFVRLERSEEAGPRSLRALLWALAGPPAGDPVRVLVAADGMQRVLRGEMVDPVRSALPALCAAVSAAHPELRCRTVDLLPPAGAQRKAWIEASSGLLIAEARHGAEPAVAYRGEERWEPLRGEAPETDLERALAEIWRELLGGPPVRRREGFFERGGDSRSALLLAERLREKLGVTLPLAEILAAPTVAGLAEAVETIGRRTRERGARPETAPSSPSLVAPTPAPRLPVADAGAASSSQPATIRLEAPAWRRLRERGARRAIAPAGLLLAALGDVIATWNDGPAFAVAVPGTGLVEIDAAAPGDFTERARNVQGRLWGALAAGAPAPSDWPVAFSFGPLESPLSDLIPPGAALLCRAGEADGALVLRWETDPARLSPEMSRAMLGAVRDHLLRLAASENGEAAWSDERRRLIPPQQLARRILAGGPGAPLPRERLEALVAAQAEAGPDRPALITPDRTLSYGELLERGHRFGRRLRELGAGPGVPVAVVLEPGETAAVAILGILAAGAAWVPVDPGLPARRFRELLTDHLVTGAGLPALAVTTRETASALSWPPEITRILLEEGLESDGASHRPPPSAADLACILPTTSGPSAMIEHRGAANALLEAARIAGLDPEDCLLALSPLGDPLALCDLFGPLTWGGSVAVPDVAERGEPARWPELIRRRGVTAWVSAPEPLARLLAAARRAGAALPLRAVLVSGRELPAGLAERLRAACPEARLTRLTPVPEAPLWAAAAPLDAPPTHYGRPLANLTLHILDPRLEPRPDGVPGALFLGGPGLARGYWRDPAGSAARFLIHPDTGERLFRTGETARVRPDGEVETFL